jgi:hypothetical protein
VRHFAKQTVINFPFEPRGFAPNMQRISNIFSLHPFSVDPQFVVWCHCDTENIDGRFEPRVHGATVVHEINTIEHPVR